MNPSLLRRSQGTRDQQKAQEIRALANYSLSLQRNTKLNATERMQALRILATR
jgi:hypothetical protein